MKNSKALKIGLIVATLVVAVLVARPPLFTIDSVADIPAPGLTPFQLWQQQMTFTVEDAPSYEDPPFFSLQQAPSGATITGNGNISWTPQTEHREMNHTFTVKATGFAAEGSPCYGNLHSDTETFVVYVC